MHVSHSTMLEAVRSERRFAMILEVDHEKQHAKPVYTSRVPKNYPPAQGETGTLNVVGVRQSQLWRNQTQAP